MLLVGVIAFALGVAGLLVLARSEWGQRWVSRQVAAALGPSVRFADARITFWPLPLALALDGVEVLDDSGAAMIRARHVLGRVRLRALAGRPPILAEVRVEDFAVELQRGADGVMRLGSTSLDGGGGGAGLPASLDAECPHVELDNGRVVLRDAGNADRTLQIDGIDAALEPTRPGARIVLDGRSAQLGTLRAEATLESLSAVASAPFHATLEARDADATRIAAWLPTEGEVLQFSGQTRLIATVQGRPTDCQAEIDLDLRNGSIAWREAIRATAPLSMALRGGWSPHGLTTADGTIDIAAVNAAGIAGRAVRAAFTADATSVTVRDAQWDALGGHWRQNGTVRFADTIALDGGVTAEAVDGTATVAALRQLAGDTVAPLQVDGALSLQATVSGTVGQPLGGHVALSMASGSAAWSKTAITAPLAISGDATLAGSQVTVSNASAQMASVSDHDLTASSIDAKFAFDGKAVQIASLTARAFDGDWTFSGAVPLSGAPTLNLSAVGINVAHLARAALTGKREEAGTAGDVDVTATLRGGSGQIALKLASPTLSFGPVVIAQPASASGKLGWSGDAVQVSNGTAQLARVRVAGTDVSAVRVAFASAGPGHLRVAPLTGRAFGGSWNVNATLSREEIDGSVRAAAIDLDDVLAAVDAGPRSEHGIASFEVSGERRRDGVIDADLNVQLARGRFLFEGLTVGAPARGTARLHVEGTRWTVSNAVVGAAAARYDFLATTNAAAQLDFDADRIRFADLRATLANAPWQGSGTIDLDQPAIDGKIAVTRADPDTVIGMLGIKVPALDPDGLDLALQIRTPLSAGWQRALQGSGAMTLRGGTLASTGLLRAIVATIVPTRALKEGGPINRLSSLKQTFTLGEARLRTADLAVDSNDYDLTAAGTIGFDGSLALDTRITLTPEGIKKMFALSSVPIPGSGYLSLPTIPARVDGTLEKPDVHPDGAALAGSTARWFADALIGAPRTITQTIVQPLDWMFDGVRSLVASKTPTPTGP